MGFSCKEFRRSAPGGLYDYAGKSSAQQTKACCLVMLCIMLAWTFFWLTEMISRCWARNFFTTPKMGEEGIHLSASQWLHTLSKRDLELPKFSQGLNHVLWLRKSRDCLPMAWNTYSWLKLKCSGILQLHGKETNSTSKHEFFCAAFTHPFQMMRVCQLLCAYIFNFLASTWVCIL